MYIQRSYFLRVEDLLSSMHNVQRILFGVITLPARTGVFEFLGLVRDVKRLLCGYECVRLIRHCFEDDYPDSARCQCNK